MECSYCRQMIYTLPYYYYKDSRQLEKDKIPFCSTLCIQEFKAKCTYYKNYNIIDYDKIIDSRKNNNNGDPGIST